MDTEDIKSLIIMLFVIKELFVVIYNKGNL